MRPSGYSQQPLVDIVSRIAGGVLEFDAVHEIHVPGDAGMGTEPHPQWPPSSILDA